MRTLLALSIGLGVLALAVGCGDGDDNGGGSGTFNSKVSDSKQLGTLSDSEVQTLCAELEQFLGTPERKSQTKELSCRTAGIFAGSLGSNNDTELQSKCKQAYDSCLKEPEENATNDCERPPAQCSATVAELEACMTDMAGALSQQLSAVPSCDTVTLEWLRSNSENQSNPSKACETYEQKCPDEDDSDIPPPSGGDPDAP